MALLKKAVVKYSQSAASDWSEGVTGRAACCVPRQLPPSNAWRVGSRPRGRWEPSDPFRDKTERSWVLSCFVFDVEKHLLAGQTLQLNNDIKSWKRADIVVYILQSDVKKVSLSPPIIVWQSQRKEIVFLHVKSSVTWCHIAYFSCLWVVVAHLLTFISHIQETSAGYLKEKERLRFNKKMEVAELLFGPTRWTLVSN